MTAAICSCLPRPKRPSGLLEDGHRGLRHLPQCSSIAFDTRERLQSIEARGKIPGQNQRVSALSNLAGLLAPHDRLVVGLLEATHPSANGHTSLGVAGGELDRAILEETAFHPGAVDHAV